MKIYDIQHDLPEEIDITPTNPSKGMYTEGKLSRPTDIFFRKIKKISLKKSRIIYIMDNATKNFDSVIKNSIYQDIFLVHKNH